MTGMRVSIRQVKAARALLAWSQEDLAAQSGIDVSTIGRIEAQDGGLPATSDIGDPICRALEAAGIVFEGENGEETGVRLQMQPAEAAGPGDDLVVEFDPGSGECVASCGGERKFIGVFETPELARTAAEEYQRELDWHKAKLAHPKV